MLFRSPRQAAQAGPGDRWHSHSGAFWRQTFLVLQPQTDCVVCLNNLQVQHPACCDALQNERDELQQVKEQLQKSKELEKSRSRFVADMSVRLLERFSLRVCA